MLFLEQNKTFFDPKTLKLAEKLQVWNTYLLVKSAWISLKPQLKTKSFGSMTPQSLGVGVLRQNKDFGVYKMFLRAPQNAKDWFSQKPYFMDLSESGFWLP